MVRGKVTWINGQKGYGFLAREDGSGDVFVPGSSIKTAGLTAWPKATRENLLFSIPLPAPKPVNMQKW
jgi:CspA family cold shock protein